MNTYKFLIVGLLLIAIGCKESPKEAQDIPETKPEKAPVPVEAMRVTRDIISREIHASGVASGIRESYVVSETQGKIEKVRFNLGQWVKKGQILVEVNATIQYAALEQAKRAASAASLNLKVVQKLFDEGNASEAELTNAQSQTTGTIAQLESAQKAYNDCQIRSPISGHIAQKDRTIEPGNVLAVGAPVGRIVDISALKATVPIGEMEIGIVKRGMPASIKVPAVNNQTFSGKVSAIAAGSDPTTGSYDIELTWKNTKERAIKSGMSVKVTITTNDIDSVLTVPMKAIIEKDRKDAVLVMQDNKAAIRFISLGRIHGNKAEIVNGISLGDIVVTSGMTVLNRGDSLMVTMVSENGGSQ